MIKFILANPDPRQKPVFRHVEEDQFFIDVKGNLCQKVGEYRHNVIAKASGAPFSDRPNSIGPDQDILRILPPILEIEF